MYQIHFDNKQYFTVTAVKHSNYRLTGKIENTEFTAEIEQVHQYEYFLRYKNLSFNIVLLKFYPDEKKLILKINGKRTTITMKDKYDLLLQQLGMDKLASKKTESIKAPMPGLVLNVLVSEGQAVKKGDTILILEAMKMENALKAPQDGIIKKIAVSKGTAVEKNQLLIEL